MAGDDPEKVGRNNENVNDQRRQFLTDNLPHMENYLIKDMPEWIKRYLDVECPRGSLWRRTVWKKFINNMGITDGGVLNKIEHIATIDSESPFYIAMDQFLGDRSFAVVIDCMLNTECMQQEKILEILENYTKSLLSQNVQNNSITFQNAEGQVTVLILHSKDENRVARGLSAEFRKNDIIVKTLTEVTQHGSESDLKILFENADFIVPVVSSAYIREIDDRFPTSAYAQYNRSVYKLIDDDYNFNRRRVRPVIVKEMKRKWVRDQKFRYSFKLWKEASKLIGVLKQTKEERTRARN